MVNLLTSSNKAEAKKLRSWPFRKRAKSGRRAHPKREDSNDQGG